MHSQDGDWLVTLVSAEMSLHRTSWGMSSQNTRIGGCRATFLYPIERDANQADSKQHTILPIEYRNPRRYATMQLKTQQLQ